MSLEQLQLRSMFDVTLAYLTLVCVVADWHRALAAKYFTLVYYASFAYGGADAGRLVAAVALAYVVVDTFHAAAIDTFHAAARALALALYAAFEYAFEYGGAGAAGACQGCDCAQRRHGRRARRGDVHVAR